MSLLSLRKCFKNWSCLVIDKIVLALVSVIQTGLGSGCLCMLNFKYMVRSNTEGFVWSWMKLPQSESPSLGNKYLVAMEILKVDEGWINQNTVNPFYELPKKSSVTWALWFVSSYSFLRHTGNPHRSTMAHIYNAEFYVHMREWSFSCLKGTIIQAQAFPYL